MESSERTPQAENEISLAQFLRVCGLKAEKFGAFRAFALEQKLGPRTREEWLKCADDFFKAPLAG